MYSFFHIRHTTGWLGLRSGLACGRFNLLLGKAQHEREQMGHTIKQDLTIDNFLSDHFQIVAGNAVVKISPKQFAQLSEQVFVYWRVTKEQIFDISTATDGQAHFEKLLEQELS